MTIEKLTPQQKKAIRKVKEALTDSMVSMTIDDIVKATGSSPTVVKNTLLKIEGVRQDENGYYLPQDDHALNAVKINMQDTLVSTQDEELNTQATHVSSPSNKINIRAGGQDNNQANLPSEQVNCQAPQVNSPDNDTDADSGTLINEGTKQAHILDEAKDAPYEKLTMPKKPRNKPFTPNLTRGYEVQRDKVKIFLDRRASSKVLTLSLDDLKELVNAVEKSERVA